MSIKFVKAAAITLAGALTFSAGPALAQEPQSLDQLLEFVDGVVHVPAVQAGGHPVGLVLEGEQGHVRTQREGVETQLEQRNTPIKPEIPREEIKAYRFKDVFPLTVDLAEGEPEVADVLAVDLEPVGVLRVARPLPAHLLHPRDKS